MSRFYKLTFLLAFVGFTVHSQPSIKFQEEIFEMGELEEGVLASYEFTFKNTGSAPLVIKEVTAACGCTLPEWPREPIAPGKEGSIMTTFNTSGRLGAFNKKITVLSNSKTAQKDVFIWGVVNKGEFMEEKTPMVEYFEKDGLIIHRPGLAERNQPKKRNLVIGSAPEVAFEPAANTPQPIVINKEKAMPGGHLSEDVTSTPTTSLETQPKKSKKTKSVKEGASSSESVVTAKEELKKPAKRNISIGTGEVIENPQPSVHTPSKVEEKVLTPKAKTNKTLPNKKDAKPEVEIPRELSEEQPVVEVSNRVINLGKLFVGTNIAFQVHFQNLGGQDLEIKDFRSSCNCVKLDHSAQSVIGPHASGNYPMIFHPQEVGAYSNVIAFYTNDKSMPVVKVKLIAQVQAGDAVTSMSEEEKSNGSIKN